MAPKKFALVKWLDTGNTGTYTVGIPLKWILDFTEEDYLKNEADKVYIVKWQCSSGLKYCKAIVVEVAENVSTLHRRITAIGGVLSIRSMQKSIKEPLESNELVSSNNNTSLKFALVNWSDGEDCGYYTAGIPVNRIINFSEKYFFKNAPNKNYLVEWQDSNGLKYNNAVVVEIAEDIETLLRLVKAIGGPLSTKMVESTVKTEPSEFIESCQAIGKPLMTRIVESTIKTEPSECNESSQAIGGSRMVETTIKAESSEHSESCESDKEETTQIFNNFSQTNSSNNSDDDEITHRRKRQKVNASTSASKEDPECYKSLLKAIFSNKKMIFDVHKSLMDIKKEIKGLLPLNSEGEICQNFKPNLVEIGKPGSKVFITAQQWAEAQSRKTYRSMGLSLLSSVFTKKVLLESNLKGGTSKVLPKKFTTMVRNPLDPKKVEAITDAVMNRFPDEYNESMFRIAINNKLSTARIKNVNKLLSKNLKSNQKNTESSESAESESDLDIN